MPDINVHPQPEHKIKYEVLTPSGATHHNTKLYDEGDVAADGKKVTLHPSNQHRKNYYLDFWIYAGRAFKVKSNVDLPLEIYEGMNWMGKYLHKTTTNATITPTFTGRVTAKITNDTNLPIEVTSISLEEVA